MTVAYVLALYQVPECVAAADVVRDWLGGHNFWGSSCGWLIGDQENLPGSRALLEVLLRRHGDELACLLAGYGGRDD